MMNTIYTIEEYMTQGFTREEAELAREFDILHNNGDFNDRYYEIAEFLGL